MRHDVRCPMCTVRFDLFEASWCDHGAAESSKICPHCLRCACRLPEYREPRLWKQAPPAFQKRGFRRLFVGYL